MYDALGAELTKDGKTVWRPFDVADVLPAMIKKRKDVFLRTDEEDCPDMMSWVRQCDAYSANSRDVVSVKRSAYLFDYGLGAVDVEITFRAKSERGFLDVYPLAEAFEEAAFEKGWYFPPGMPTDWSAVDALVARALRASGFMIMTWLKPVGAGDLMLETCCWALQLREDAAGIPMTRALVRECFSAFCGQDMDETAFQTGVAKIPAIHTGFSGNAAFVVDRRTAERCSWNWRLVALLYGALLESADPIFDVVSDLVDDGNSSTSTGDIRRIRLVVDLLHNECSPEIICSESLDSLVYGNVFTAWGGPEVERCVDARADFLAKVLADLESQRAASLQKRLNVVVFVLTIVSVASTVASVLALLDYESPPNFDAFARGEIVAIVTAALAFACVLVLVMDVTYVQRMLTRVKRAVLRIVSGLGTGGRWRSAHAHVGDDALISCPKDGVVVVKTVE